MSRPIYSKSHSANAFRKLCRILCALPLLVQAEDPVHVLEEFIVDETRAEEVETLLPSARPVDSVFGGGLDAVEIPRAVTVVTAETMERLQIDDFTDLPKAGAGMQPYNFFGVPGAPFLRGWEGGVYFNGMLRAYQRNQMPVSFGSLEAMDIVKGPAPAHFSPTQAGGYVNFIPKPPYFNETSGSVELEAGTHDHWRAQLDQGGPLLLGEKVPLAYRLSFTGQKAGSYYNNVKNDFVSLYAAVKAEPVKNLKVFTGGEYYHFESNENVGWNRPTQNLIDRGRYVIGEPVSVARKSWGGRADRNAIDMAAYMNIPELRALVIPAGLVDEAVAGGSVPAAARDAMLDLSDPAQRETVYSRLPAGMTADMIQTDSGYLYTPGYFQNGGKVFTTKIGGDEVLSDSRDQADARDFLYFCDFAYQAVPDCSVTNKILFEYLETDKYSSYGYAFDMRQLVFSDRLSLAHDFGWLRLDGGAEFRYTSARHLEDFWTEPFPRRDISRSSISPNTIVRAGFQEAPGRGINYWGGGFPSPGGDNNESDLYQTALFALADAELTPWFKTYFGLRGEHAAWDSRLPDEVDVSSRPGRNDNTNYLNGSVNPVIQLSENINLYGAAQYGKTAMFTGGGTVRSKENFGNAELYEAGLKASLLEGRLFASAAVYYWDQGTYNDRAGYAEIFRSKGLEIELAWEVNDKLSVLAAFTSRRTHNRSSELCFRSMDFGLADPLGEGNEERGVALEGGAFYNTYSPPPEWLVKEKGGEEEAAKAFQGWSGNPPGNPDLEVPASPETTFQCFAVYKWGNGFGASAGAVWNDSYWANYDHTRRYPPSLVLGFNLFYESARWDVSISVENAADEDYFAASSPTFAANTLAAKAPGREAKLSARYKF